MRLHAVEIPVSGLLDAPASTMARPWRGTALTAPGGGRKAASVGHIDVSGIEYSLADGRPLLADVSFRVGEGACAALIGPNGTGKTTLLRIVTGELAADEGAVTRSGGVAFMPQFIGSLRDSSTVRDLLLSVSPPPIRAAAAEIDAVELELMNPRRPRRSASATPMRWATGPTCTATNRRTCSTPAPSPPSASPTTGRSTGRSVRCPAASRNAWSSNCCSPGRTRYYCSTSRTTTSTCPARSGWSAGWRRPRSPCCSSPTTESCCGGPRLASSRSNPVPPGRCPGCTAADSIPIRRRGRSATPGWKNCGCAGTSSTRSSRRWC